MVRLLTVPASGDGDLLGAPSDALAARGPGAYGTPGEYYDRGAEHLQRYAKSVFSALDAPMRGSLASYLASTPCALGSVCSGTDCPILVAEALRRACKDVFSADWDMRHAFSCENNKAKQRFLATVFPDVKVPLFSNALHLDQTMATDAKSMGMAVVPDCGALVAGFPCTDVSRLNPHKGSNRSTIADASLKTGSVFGALLAYIRCHGKSLRWCLFENVVGLADKGKEEVSNADVCVKMLEELGFQTVVFKLCPTQMQWPVARPRLWFLCMKKDSTGSSDIEDFATEVMATAFRAASPMNLDDLLLREDHCALQAHMQDKDVTRDAKRRRTRQESWPTLHHEVCRVAGIEWGTLRGASAEDFSLWPGLRTLTPRELDILACHQVRYPDRCGCIDLSHALDRGLIRTRHLSCVTPNMRCYLMHRCRLVCGLESLHLQGLHYGSLHKAVESFPNALLADLAGNAFHSYCCAASMVTVLTCCAWQRTHAQVSSCLRTLVDPSTQAPDTPGTETHQVEALLCWADDASAPGAVSDDLADSTGGCERER